MDTRIAKFSFGLFSSQNNKVLQKKKKIILKPGSKLAY